MCILQLLPIFQVLWSLLACKDSLLNPCPESCILKQVCSEQPDLVISDLILKCHIWTSQSQQLPLLVIHLLLHSKNHPFVPGPQTTLVPPFSPQGPPVSRVLPLPADIAVLSQNKCYIITYGTLQSRSRLFYMLYEKWKSTLCLRSNTHIKHDCAIYGGEVHNMGLGSPDQYCFTCCMRNENQLWVW